MYAKKYECKTVFLVIATPTENNHLKLINYGRINRWINMDKFILGC
jgi:hypothetical protein